MHRSSLPGIAFATALMIAALAPAAAAKDGATDNLPVRVTMTVDGPAMSTPAGMTLYLNSNEDTRSERFSWECTDVAPTVIPGGVGVLGEHKQIGWQHLKSCLQKFRPYLADASARPVGDFTIVDRPDGTRQWVYRGMTWDPLESTCRHASLSIL